MTEGIELSSMKFIIENEKEEHSFKEIADKLFNHYVIETHDSKYRLTEIEFYWKSEVHDDKSTYPRKYVNPESGEWFFHYSGVDIALKNQYGYGGILIRGIYDLFPKEDKQKVYNGPMICAMRLFSGTSIFGNSIQTKLVPYNFPDSTSKQFERINLGDNAKINNMHIKPYRFKIEHSK